ncbi:MAG: N-acyl amino acid synthase FeeM domain-containing protein [Nannocystaceae bacterium]
MSYRAICATSTEEKAACYHLRYRIYVEQAKVVAPDHPYVQGEFLVDPYDAYSTQILLLAGETPIGTARITCARDGKLELEAYKRGSFTEPRHVTCEITRLMILREWRCLEASGVLFYCLYKKFTALNAHRVLAAGKLGRLARYYKNLGLKVVEGEAFAYRLIPNAYYHLMLGDFGESRSLRRTAWDVFFGSSIRLVRYVPKVLRMYYRRGLSMGRIQAPGVSRAADRGHRLAATELVDCEQ